MLARIREAAEQAKIKLSTETEVEIALPFLTPDFSFSYKLTRAELENLTRDIIAADAAALPARAGGREAGGERSGSNHSGWRPDADAAGAEICRRTFWLRGF